IILLIACINFMNLSTARSEQRAKEVGVRKTLGAQRGRLLLQFIMESVLLSVISTVIAIFIITIILPSFNALVGEQLVLHLFSPLHISCLIGIALVCGLVAGSYPALFLSSFKPVAVLNGLKLKGVNSAGWVRKILVVVQFSVSIILIICTLIIYLQINHVKNRDLGYNRHNLVFTTVQGNMLQHFGAIRNDLIQTGYVQDACLSDHEILRMYSNGGGWNWPGKDPNSQVLITFESASPQYVPTMGLNIMKGRDFYPDMKEDSAKVLINESFAKIIGLKNIIGTVITNSGGTKYTIVGVIKDFLYNSMYSTPSPLIVFSDTSNSSYLTVRYKPDANLEAAVSKTRKVISKNNPGYPVEINFVDADFNNLFKMESMIGQLAGLFAALAILISCLGLFGLAAYTAERRTKEIGIRKVMGASVRRIVGLLSKDFLILVIISCLIAFPVSWWIMHQWLQDYPYRITIHWWIFFIAGGLAIVIALLTVSFQAIRAAVANPVESLRTE
ncbi:MAG: FtsX-like permease family protein, partial [Chitinophagaceae bacterium]